MQLKKQPSNPNPHLLDQVATIQEDSLLAQKFKELETTNELDVYEEEVRAAAATVIEEINKLSVNQVIPPEAVRQLAHAFAQEADIEKGLLEKAVFHGLRVQFEQSPANKVKTNVRNALATQTEEQHNREFEQLLSFGGDVATRLSEDHAVGTNKSKSKKKRKAAKKARKRGR